MIKLLKLEFAKIKPTRYFKVLTVLWLIAFFSIPIGYNILVVKLTEGVTMESSLLNPQFWPFFDFEDIWQNFAYVYKMITVFVCLMLIISTTNEFDYKTARQNIINGLSKRKFWLSKITLIISTALIATVMLFGLGLIAGFINSPITSIGSIFENIEFMFAYFLHVVHFLMFTFVISLLIRRAGFTIALVLFWTYIVEPIVSGISAKYFGIVGDLFPMEAGWNLIQVPFLKYGFQETQDYVSIQDWAIALVWIGLFAWSSYALITKRDI